MTTESPSSSDLIYALDDRPAPLPASGLHVESLGLFLPQRD